MKKLLLTSTLCVGVLFSNISASHCLENTNTLKESMVKANTGQSQYSNYQETESGLAIEGRVVKEYVVRIKISKKVLEVLSNQNI